MARHRLSDEQWECIAAVFPPAAKTGRPRADLRQVVDGILWILRTGAPWRDIPEEDFGPWETVYTWFNQWSSDGTLDEIVDRLKAAMTDTETFDHELWCIDGHGGPRPSVCCRGREKKDPREPKDHALGRSRGGFSTKIHLLSDGQGHPLHAEVTAGQAHDSTAFTTVLENARITDYDGELDVSPVHLGGDKAFDAEWIRDWLDERDITPVIPHRGEIPEARHPDFDREMYRRRNVIERLVGWLKECRRLFARYEKTAINFLGFIKMGFVHYYLRLFCPE